MIYGLDAEILMETMFCKNLETILDRDPRRRVSFKNRPWTKGRIYVRRI